MLAGERGFCTGWIAGIMVPLILPSATILTWSFILGGACLCAVLLRQRPMALGLLLAGVLVITYVKSGQDARLDDFTGEAQLSGRIESLVRQGEGWIEFEFLADSGPWGAGLRRLRVRAYDQWPAIAPAERWSLRLRIKAPRGTLNFAGSDRERWLFHEGVHGLARLVPGYSQRLAAPLGSFIVRVRQFVRDRVTRRLDGAPGSPMVLGLGLGDRSVMSPATRKLLVATGTGHLLAISGLHIGTVALLSTLLFRLVMWIVPWHSNQWSPRRLSVAGGVLVAGAYAALAGFGTSPQRAFIMVSVVALGFMTRRQMDAWTGWFIALVIVTAINPLAPMGAGFWLSFGAVGCLLYVFRNRWPQRRVIGSAVHAQWVLGIMLMPLNLLVFSQASGLAFGVNLLAIPWVSFITLPLTLLGMLATVFDGLAGEILLHMAARSADLFLISLHTLMSVVPVGVVRSHEITLGLAVIATLGGCLVCAPAALRLRFLGFLILPAALFYRAPEPGEGEWQLDVLDVAQGSAALLRTRNHLLLVDSGPGIPGRWNYAEQVIIPAAQALGGEPDLGLISHGDLDHSGGLDTLAGLWRRTRWIGNLRQPRPAVTLGPCHDALAWHWDSVSFEVLHPTRFLPYQGNNSSCVLSVSGQGGSVLLPGDIESMVERRLTQTPTVGWDAVLVPHHGSKSSSSSAFIAWADADWFLVSSAQDNRYGFPHASVQDRYRSLGHTLHSTAKCGALRLLSPRKRPVEVMSARRSRAAFWRRPPPASCP